MSGGGVGDGYGTKTVTMDSVASEFDNVNGQLATKFRNLADLMNSTTSGWQGQAGDAFRRLMQTYNTDAEKLNTALKNIATQLHTQKTSYVNIHSQSAQMLSDIQKKLGG